MPFVKTKGFYLRSFKEPGQAGTLGDGNPVTDADISKINRFSTNPVPKEKIFSKRVLIANNQVDRDNEAFADNFLGDLKTTLPGKSLLRHHDRRSDADGLVFDAWIEKTTKKAFAELVGEKEADIIGPDQARLLWGKVFLLKQESNQDDREKIDAGILGQHASIGFSASKMIEVEKSGKYWEEIRGPGEARELSFVYLGAQRGAGTKEPDDEPKSKKKGNKMESEKLATFLGHLSEIIGQKLSESTAVEKIKAVVTSLNEKVAGLEEKIKTLETENATLKPLAEQGKAYHKKMVETYALLKIKLKEVGDKPEEKTALTKMAEDLPLAFIEGEIKSLEKRVEEKFGDTYVLDDEKADPDKNKNKKKSYFDDGDEDDDED